MTTKKPEKTEATTERDTESRPNKRPNETPKRAPTPEPSATPKAPPGDFYDSIAGKRFLGAPAGQRLKSITDQIEKRATEEWKKLAANERAKMPAIFKDEELWQK